MFVFELIDSIVKTEKIPFPSTYAFICANKVGKCLEDCPGQKLEYCVETTETLLLSNCSVERSSFPSFPSFHGCGVESVPELLKFGAVLGCEIFSHILKEIVFQELDFESMVNIEVSHILFLLIPLNCIRVNLARRVLHANFLWRILQDRPPDAAAFW
jgi:hypothetical protein